MSSPKHSARMIRSALFSSALLSFGVATSLLSQQQAVAPAQGPATPASAPAPAADRLPTPAPAPSPLFTRNDADDHSIAAAQAADRAARSRDNHTIVVSTLVLVLGVVILVLLIA